MPDDCLKRDRHCLDPDGREIEEGKKRIMGNLLEYFTYKILCNERKILSCLVLFHFCHPRLLLCLLPTAISWR